MINRIREAREKLGFSQEQVAMMAGMKQQTISAYELGDKLPGTVNLLKLSKVLHCHADELLILEDGD